MCEDVRCWTMRLYDSRFHAWMKSRGATFLKIKATVTETRQDGRKEHNTAEGPQLRPTIWA